MLFLRSARIASPSSCSLSSTSSKTLSLMRRPPKSEIKRCALVDLCFRPDLAAVPADNPLHGSQPDPGTLKFRGCVQALENAKQLACIRRIEPGTVVPNKKDKRL